MKWETIPGWHLYKPEQPGDRPTLRMSIAGWHKRCIDRQKVQTYQVVWQRRKRWG